MIRLARMSIGQGAPMQIKVRAGGIRDHAATMTQQLAEDHLRFLLAILFPGDLPRLWATARAGAQRLGTPRLPYRHQTAITVAADLWTRRHQTAITVVAVESGEPQPSPNGDNGEERA
jgi:hypothetical protein